MSLAHLCDELSELSRFQTQCYYGVAIFLIRSLNWLLSRRTPLWRSVQTHSFRHTHQCRSRVPLRVVRMLTMLLQDCCTQVYQQTPWDERFQAAVFLAIQKKEMGLRDSRRFLWSKDCHLMVKSKKYWRYGWKNSSCKESVESSSLTARKKTECRVVIVNPTPLSPSQIIIVSPLRNVCSLLLPVLWTKRVEFFTLANITTFIYLAFGFLTCFGQFPRWQYFFFQLYLWEKGIFITFIIEIFKLFW